MQIENVLLRLNFRMMEYFLISLELRSQNWGCMLPPTGSSSAQWCIRRQNHLRCLETRGFVSRSFVLPLQFCSSISIILTLWFTYPQSFAAHLLLSQKISVSARAQPIMPKFLVCCIYFEGRPNICNMFHLQNNFNLYMGGKGKVIPLHAMEAHEVRGGTAPAHS
jgi:hypothetical protein